MPPYGSFQSFQSFQPPPYNHAPSFPTYPQYPPTAYYPNPSPQHHQTHQNLTELHGTLVRQIEQNKKRKKRKKQKKKIKKQQHSAASTLQRWWKQQRVVTKWRDPMLRSEVQRLLLNNQLANSYLDEMIEQYFLTEFIPDLFIEILSTENRDQFYQKDVLSQMTWSFYEGIEQEICSELCTQICNETIDEIVGHYFHSNRKGLHLKSILHHIQHELLHQEVAVQTKEVVEESISELILEYLIENKAVELYNGLLPDLVERTVNDALIGYILDEDIMNDFLFGQCLDEWIGDIAAEEYGKVKQLDSEEKKAREFDLVESCLVRHLLNDEMLNALIRKMSTRSEASFIANQAVNVLIKSEMSQILIKKNMNLYEVHSRTKRNCILNEMLTAFLAESAIDPFIEYLQDQ